MSILLAAKALKENVSIIDLLSRLGYEPVKKSGREKFYISMIRDDDTNPSFTVNDELGVWFDHGIRKGGNIIDLGLAYWKNLGFREVVEKLTAVADGQYLGLPPVEKISRPRLPVKLPHYIVLETKPLGTHPAITEYLRGRGLFDVGKKFLSEIYYYVENDTGARKHFFSAGWQNENNGWEVRNKYFKGCIGPQGITFIKGNDKKVAIFEGYLNFLSWRTENLSLDHSIIVLNSVTALKAGIGKAKAFSSIDVYFDRDKAGFLATKEFIYALPYATDRSPLYDGFNDYNDKIKAKFKAISADEKAHKNIFSDLKVPFER
ncbi:hypothetical protein SNE26_24040 [Mucilaginibacter sp. cycad4]|uniref:hypothetical protein n=1 Tax=Mucilaginibacter sp. cycad4 TaxID=3342096 RepID=UPI002AABC4D5|nr:hypothetical protein [Mucilaginibacter gossypii]WPU99088.1 hypothetical protein SNE26_24040 [Mucilaginibacter gossypii]